MDYSEEGNVVQKSNGTIKADDGYYIHNHFVFNTIDGHYAIAYVVINMDSNFSYDTLKELKFNPKDTEKPVMSLYANVIKDGFDQKILLFQYYDKFLKYSSILGCHAGFTSFDIQSSICFIILNFYVTPGITMPVITKFIKFSTSGTVIQTGTSNTGLDPRISRGPTVIPLKFGGYFYCDINSLNQFLTICNIDDSCDSFTSPELNINDIFCGVFDNNTIWTFIKTGDYTTGSWYIIIKDAKQFIKDSGFNNPAILSTQPEQNKTLTFLSSSENINIINITFFTPIILSTGNLIIYQVINKYNYLLRQIYPASSCTLIHNNKNNNTAVSVSCKVLSSTFNRINSTYTIVLDDGFVQTLSFNEPLNGIKRDIWQVKTPKFYSSEIVDSTTATLKLNLNQSFYQQIKDDLYRQIITSLPIDSNRLHITGNVQPDFVDSNILIEFSVIKTTDSSNEPSVNDIINDLNDMIKNKDTSALFGQKYTMFLDSNYGFQIKASLWNEVKFKLLAAAIVMFLLLIIYYFVRKKNLEGNNMFIFKIVLIILDFILDILFIVVNGHDVQVLFAPSILFMVISTFLNFCFTFIILMDEIQSNSEFRNWFVKNVKIVSICTLLSCPDVEALNLLSSQIANLKIFMAPFSEKAEIRIYYGTIINIFIEDIPQFIIQVIYYTRVITYSSIPLFSLIMSSMLLFNNFYQ
ncbi:hypothetical protein C2G38_2248480 [Gigaspora rosea]|uniref:Uncharacterized protein n=1 Tax=Gigaspora rosea TaxID=44941 RepID=A0A397UY14_9GLOM|nr:hypothetical protein C2G38_2248480 [Gigaspora rosea]